MFKNLLKRQSEVSKLIIDYPAMPRLPNGATAILEHSPVSSVTMPVHQTQFGLVPITVMESYEGFPGKNPDSKFADALWLDVFIKTLAPNGKRSSVVEKAFLDNFIGQIFFLATTFDTEAGPAYAFFNWSEVAPVGRYLCPVGNPVRQDIPVYAAIYQE